MESNAVRERKARGKPRIRAAQGSKQRQPMRGRTRFQCCEYLPPARHFNGHVLHSWKMRSPPPLVRVFQHNLDEDRDQPAQYFYAVFELPLVETAIGSGAAMHQLVAQNIEASKNMVESLACVLPDDFWSWVFYGATMIEFSMDIMMAFPKISPDESVVRQ